MSAQIHQWISLVFPISFVSFLSLSHLYLLPSFLPYSFLIPSTCLPKPLTFPLYCMCLLKFTHNLVQNQLPEYNIFLSWLASRAHIKQNYTRNSQKQKIPITQNLFNWHYITPCHVGRKSENITASYSLGFCAENVAIYRQHSEFLCQPH